MPDISDLSPSLVGAYLATSLGGLHSNRPREERSIAGLLARLVDKAIQEYSAAREAAVSEEAEGKLTYQEIIDRAEGQFLYTCTIINHLENCINALSRIHKLRQRLGPSSQFAVDADKEIRRIRNLIEHMDGEIVKSTVGSYSLNVAEDALNIEICGKTLSIAILAEEIRTIFTEVKRVFFAPNRTTNATDTK